MNPIPRHYAWVRRTHQVLGLGPRAALRWLVTAVRARFRGPRDAPPFPSTVSIELTDHGKPSRPSPSRPATPQRRGFAGAPWVRSVIDECALEPSFTTLEFSGYGEPFLHPDLCGLSRYAKRRQVPIVRTYATGSALAAAHTEAILTEGAFDEIILALNGVAPGARDRSEGQDGYEEAVQNVRRFLRRKRELRRRRPFVDLVFLVPPGESRDLEALAGDWRPLLGPGDCVRVGPGHDPAGQAASAWLGDDAPASPRQPCGQLWRSLYVARGGQVSPCAVDPFRELSVGNATTTAMRRIWESAALEDLRRVHEAGEYGRAPTCEACERWGDVP